MREDTRDLLTGVAVTAAIAAAFVAVASRHASNSDATSRTYEISAVFPRADGVRAGTPVRVAGVAVGSVAGQELSGASGARVRMSLDRAVALPADTSAAVETDGLLAGKYIEITPGGDDDMLPAGGVIGHAQGSVMLDELLAKVSELALARQAKCNLLDKEAAHAAQSR